MSRRSIVTLVVLVALVAGMLGWWTTRSVAVSGVTVRTAPLVRTLQFSARVVTSSRVDIGSTLTGRVLQVAVTEGAQVKKGELLVELESDELRAALDQARANERQATARLSGLRSTGRNGAQAAVAQADSVLLAAQAELKRTQALVAKGFISEARLDETLRAVAVAEAQRDSARAQMTANAEQGTDITQAQAQLALASAAIAAAKARLAQAVLTTPADAKVLSRAVEPGQIVQPGRALLSLALASRLQLLAQVDERYLDQLRVGQAASVVADAFPDQRFAARVQSIAPLVDTQRGAVEVKLSLPPQPPDFLKEDMTLSVEVETARREGALVVPIGALRGDDASATAVLWIEVGGQVEERKVRTGIRSLDAVEVLEGLSVGDKVLIGASPNPGSRVHLKVIAHDAKPISKSANDGVGSALTNAMGR
jgi:HlyD family secretion protein